MKAGSLIIRERSTVVTLTAGDGDDRRAEDVKFFFQALTPKVWEEISLIKKGEGDEKAVLVRQLVILKLRSDDILKDEGSSPMPLTEDYLDQWDVFNLERVLSAIMEESLPKAKSLPPTGDSSLKGEQESAEATSLTGSST